MNDPIIAIAHPEGVPELELVSESLRKGFEDHGRASIISADADSGLTATCGRRSIRLFWDPARAVLSDRDAPVAIGVEIHPALLSGLSLRSERVCLNALGSARALRMRTRVVQEMRRRGQRSVLTTIGDCGDDWADECLPELSGEELLRLLLTSRCYVDTGWEEDGADLTTAVALAAGVRVVAYRSRRLPAGRVAVTVAEWSADAFCEVILARPGDGPAIPAGPADGAVGELLRALALA